MESRDLPFVKRAKEYIEVTTPPGVFVPPAPVLNGGGKAVATVWEMVESCAETHGARHCLGVREHVGARRHHKGETVGKYVWLTYGEARALAECAGAALVNMGARRGEQCAVVGCNSPEYVAVALGAVRQGCVPVLLPFNSSAAELAGVLRRTGLRLVLCNAGAVARLAGACAALERDGAPLPVRAVVVVPGVPGAPGTEGALADADVAALTARFRWRVLDWGAFVRLGRKRPRPAVLAGADDAFAVLHTSGTTGAARAVVLSHRAALAAGDAVAAHPQLAALARAPERDALVEYCNMSLATIAALAFTLGVLRLGGAVGFPSTPLTTSDASLRDMKQLRPTVLNSVPQMWEVAAHIVHTQSTSGNVIRRRLLKHTLSKVKCSETGGGGGGGDGNTTDSGSSSSGTSDSSSGMSSPTTTTTTGGDGKTDALTALTASIMKKMLGGRIRVLAVSGSFLSPRTAAWTRRVLSLDPLQCYGQTEYFGCGLFSTRTVADTSTATRQSTSAGYCPPGTAVRLVTVGDGAEYSIAHSPPTGELYVRAQTMFAGYLGDDAATAAVVDDDGWFRTGDVGQLNADGTISILARLSDDCKLSNGRFAQTALLNSAYGLSPLCRHVFTYARRGTAFVVAAVCVDLAALDDCAMLPSSAREASARARANPKSTAVRRLLDMPDIAALYLREFARIAAENDFNPHQVVRGVVLDAHEWSADNGLLTPSGKLCKAELLRRYQDDLDRLVARVLRDEPLLVEPTPIEEKARASSI